MLNTLLDTTTLMSEAPAARAPSWLDRLRSALARTRTDDTVEAYIQVNGGVMTDQLEREISRRFGGVIGR